MLSVKPESRKAGKPESDNELVVVEATGELSKDDYGALHPLLRGQLSDATKPSLLVVMRDFEGWSSIAAFWDDIKIDAELQYQVRKVAAVGDKGWQAWMTKMAKPFAQADIRWFDLDQL